MLERWQRCCSSLEGLNRRPLALGLLASALVQGLGAVSGVLAARALGPHDRGVLATALLWPQLLILVGGLGIAEALTVHIARAPQQARAAVLSAAVVITGGQAGVLLLLGGALARTAGGRVLHGAAALALPALAFIPVYLATLALMAALSGLRCFALVHALRLLISGGYALALGVLLRCDRLTPLTALLAYTGTHLLAGLAATAACARGPGFRRSGWRMAARPLLSYGLRSQLGTLCAALCERADQVVVAALQPPARLGAYLAAVSLTAPVGLAGAAVAATALPVVAAAPPGTARAEVARRYVCRAAVIALLIALPLAAGAPWLVVLCFGTAFSDAVLPARVLMLGAGVWSVGRVLGAVQRAVGAPGAAARCDLLAALGVVGGLLVLVPRLGISGAAAAVSLGSMAGTAAAVRSTARALAGRPSSRTVPGLSLGLPGETGGRRSGRGPGGRGKGTCRGEGGQGGRVGGHDG